MATYLELYGLVGNEDFQHRVDVALWRASGNVMQEADSVADHSLRLNLATRIISGGMQTPRRVVMIAVLQVSAIFSAGEAATDSQIQTAVDNIFTILARMEARYGA